MQMGEGMDPFKVSGILYLWNTRILFATDRMQTEFHEHYAATVAIGLKENLTIETGNGIGEYRAALVTPNTNHRTLSAGVKMIAFILDPEVLDFQSIVHHSVQNQIIALDFEIFRSLLPELWDLYYGQIDSDQAHAIQLKILKCLNPGSAPEEKLDSRVQKVARRIRNELPDRIRLDDLAQEFSISEDRLMRLFKESLGLPMRRYLLWVRLTEAARFLMEGMNLTDAAHAAGFSDSAHFSRTFKENFGFVPSQFFGQWRSVNLMVCKSEDTFT